MTILPIEYRWLKAQGFNGLLPWHLLGEDGDERLRNEYQKETGEDFYPFAYRQDCDDVAGFKIINRSITREVVNVHLTWRGSKEIEGYPAKETFSDMFEWFKNVVLADTWEWMSEEGLKELQKNEKK